MADLRAGTLYDDAGIGVLIRTGWMQGYFKNLGITKQYTKNKFQCYGIMGAHIKAIAYNATLQGGIFNKRNAYTISFNEMRRSVVTGKIGIVIAYKRVSIEYTNFYISREFKNGLSHGWGHVLLSFVSKHPSVYFYHEY